MQSAERIPLLLPGSRAGPHPDAVRLAEQVVSWWTRARSNVQSELYAHYCAGRDAGVPDMPDLPEPSAVWPHVTLSSVQVAPYGSLNDAQVALRVSWDEEHTLGALFRDATLVELNGSILEVR